VGYLLRDATGGGHGDIVQEIIAIVRQVASGLPPEQGNPLDDEMPGGSQGPARLLNYATNNIHDKAMQEQAVAVGEHLIARSDGSLELDLPLDLLGLYSQAYGRYSYTVIDDRGRVLFSSLKDHAALFPADKEAGDVEFLQQRRGDATVSGASIRKTVSDKTVWIQAGEGLANRDVLIDDIVADFYRNVGWITLPILLVLLVADIAIFRRALRPLRQASEIASHIGPTRTGLRLPTEEILREVRPLVSAVNQALDRLEEGLRIQRDFTADAAHELRTPLSILRTRLDTLEDEKIGRALRLDVEGMAHIISQLLDIAELDAFVVDPSEKANLRAVTAEVAEFVAPLVLAQGKDIALLGATESVWVRGNAEMLGRAIRNVAENAINHTGPGTTVEFIVEENGTVSILDQGPGVAEDERKLIFQRFWRGDRNKAGSTGLGLSIVQRIAELHSATITVENRLSGGAQFSIRFLATYKTTGSLG
jgi:signal transduction histidine kinase